MSNQENTPHKASDEQASNTVEQQVTPAPVPEPKPRRRGGFFSSLVSHLMVALIAVIAVTTYMHWVDILKYTGTRVCAYDMLGQYAGQPAKVPPVDMKKPVTEKTKEKTTPQKTPAEEKPQADTSTAPKDNPQTDKFKQARDAARKLFWTESKSAIAAYEKLLADYPDNARLRAETGNVYYKNDMKQQAVEAYLVAAKGFIQQKDQAGTDEMIKVLQKLAPEKAKKLIAEKAKAAQ